MRIQWLSNAPWANTGYGNQTRTFLPRLRARGHEMACIAFYGADGAVLNWDGFSIYPKGLQPYGQDVVGAHSAQHKADITISLMDAWVCEPDSYHFEGWRTRWVPWFPVDMEPLPEIIRKPVSKAYQPIVFSKFGERLAQAAGLDTRYVPHGCDTATYSPGSKVEARETARMPTDRFIVGMVAANKGNPSRKAFCQQIEAFARLHRRHPDTLLYLHTMRGGGQAQMVNLPELIEYLGIADAVRFADPYHLLIGYSDAQMATLYRTFDVLMNVSLGEGFGVPILEAQACGTPVIVGDWTSMSELCWGGWAIDKTDADPYWTALAAYQYQPRIGAIEEALQAAYDRAGDGALGAMARAGAEPYDADRVTDTYWKPVLAELQARIAAESEPIPMPRGGLGSAKVEPDYDAMLDAYKANTGIDLRQQDARVRPPNRAERRALAKAAAR